jgi:type VI secretion system protein ImpM
MNTVAGWYGKIAALGDFAHRRLPPDWIAHCDAWLSDALATARADLGNRWLDVYLTAPLLAFVWADAVADRHWWTGVLMPSCDSVGRYFPLVVAAPVSGPPTSFEEAAALERWYAEIGAVALATLDDRTGSVHALESAIAGVAPWKHPVAGAARPDGRALSSSLAGLRRGHSAWWPQGASPDGATVIDGLPDGRRLADLFALRPHDDLSTVVGP